MIKQSGSMIELPLGEIKFSKNYRHTFPDKSLKELASSIEQHGVIEPIVVRRHRESFELIAGDRRLRASKIAGMETIPARVIDATDAQVLELQLVENVQREAVPFYEEALALKRLQDAPYNYTHEQIAQKIGKSTSYVTFQLQLTKMSHEARRACENREISKSVAWLIARLPNENMQSAAARALRRKGQTKLVGERAARHFIEDLKAGNLSGDRTLSGPRINSNGNGRPIPNKFYTADMSDYLKNWKRYLVSMSPEQLAEWKTIVDGRTDTLVWARAVEAVMTRHDEKRA